MQQMCEEKLDVKQINVSGQTHILVNRHNKRFYNFGQIFPNSGNKLRSSDQLRKERRDQGYS